MVYTALYNLIKMHKQVAYVQRINIKSRILKYKLSKELPHQKVPTNQLDGAALPKML